ncbi:MAG: hypothetical protein ABIU05_16880 [Nitrospirales bacterium]
MTAVEIAKNIGCDASTIRRGQAKGLPVVRKGKRGPGNAAQYDLDEVVKWRGRANGPVGHTPDEVMQRIAVALLDCLQQDRVDIRAGIEKEAAAAVLIVVFENCCKTFDRRFRFDEQPPAICALMHVL